MHVEGEEKSVPWTLGILSGEQFGIYFIFLRILKSIRYPLDQRFAFERRWEACYAICLVSSCHHFCLIITTHDVRSGIAGYPG